MDLDNTGGPSTSRRTMFGALVDTPVDPAVRTFDEGSLVAGRFRIVALLGRGGMGEVYEAEDLELADRIALKTISSQGPFDAAAVDQFRREVHLARRITHPNICRVHDVVRHATPERDVLALSMELLRGQTLRERLHHAERLPLQEALAIVRQIASALDAMHAANIVHRDLKSSNVMLVADERRPSATRAVVMDFGLAHHVTESPEAADTSLMGTPAYMAPEQLEGGPVGPATDIYALGVILFELVCGRLPFEGQSPLKAGLARLEIPPPRPRLLVAGLPVPLEEAILRCLARNPADRYGSAAEVVSVLEGLGDGAPSRRDGAMRRRVLTAAAVMAAVLVAFAAWRGLSGRADSQSSTVAAAGVNPAPAVDVAVLRAASKAALERGDLAAAFDALSKAKAARPDDPEIDRDIAALLVATEKAVGRLRELDALNEYLKDQARKPATLRVPLTTAPLRSPSTEGAPIWEAARQAVQAAAPAPVTPPTQDDRDAITYAAGVLRGG
jgi:hypothetical protein